MTPKRRPGDFSYMKDLRKEDFMIPGTKTLNLEAMDEAAMDLREARDKADREAEAQTKKPAPPVASTR